VNTSPDHTLVADDAMAFELLAGRLGAGATSVGPAPDVMLSCFCLTWATGRGDEDLEA
jgi:hypothetical protein